MQDKNTEVKGKRILEKTLDSISVRKKAPWAVYVILLVIYVAINMLTSYFSASQVVVKVGHSVLPMNAFAGVMGALSNICTILMTLYFGKLGFITSIFALGSQFPKIIMGIITSNNLNSLPGIFTNILAMITIIIIYVNDTRIINFQNKLRDQAVTDTLTELPNRFALSEVVRELIRQGEKFVFVAIDINDFKSINDTMGFDAGNAVLKEIASRWKAIADSGISGTLDFIARISGDEFNLIIREYHSNEDVTKTINQYESALNSRMTIDDCDFYITASFGYAEFPADAKKLDSLASYSTAAMNEVKRVKSSNHVLRFTPDLLKIERTLEIEGKIRAALENDTIYFNLQPQFDMEHNLRGFEALARMKDDDGNNISPGEFIPVSEKVGLVDKVDATVFRKSAMFFGSIIKETGLDITLSVNVSVRHLMKNDFLDEVRSVLEESGIPPQQLEIEITESIMIDSVDKAIKVIGEVEKIGVKIAIDDFGTGYSSLSYLNKFPADLLKIDKSFIDKMNTNESSKQYVAAIISIGHIMGFKVISEGVEEEAQIETLKSIDCDYIQGFIWGRPLMSDAAEKLMRDEAERLKK